MSDALKILQNQLASFEDDEVKLEQELKTNKAAIKDLVDEVTARRSRISALETEGFNLKQQLSRLRRNKGHVDRELQKLQREIRKAAP